MKNSVSENRSPLKFFIIVYGLSIPLWIIERFIDVKGLPLNIPITDILAAFTPLITASILVYKEEGKTGIKRLFKSVFDYNKIKKKTWYLPIIFLPFLMYLWVFLIIYLLKRPFSITFPETFLSISILFIFFFLGAIAEEVGYMGYAIDPMQDRFGALKAAILIGIPWAIWHYPSIIQQGHNAVWIAWGTLGTVAVRVLIVWIYNNTGKSVFACILFHTLLNVGRVLYPKDATHNPLVDYPDIHYSTIMVTAMIIVFYGVQKR